MRLWLCLALAVCASVCVYLSLCVGGLLVAWCVSVPGLVCCDCVQVWPVQMCVGDALSV